MTDKVLTADPAAPLESSASRLSDKRRLTVLRDSELMDSLPEEAFQRLTRLASKLLGTPVSLLSLVDETRQFFKAETGLEDPLKSARGTPLSHSFCQYVVCSAEPLMVRDARRHPTLKHNGSTLENGVVAYLGVPVRAPGGEILGSFCAIDSSPRDWTQEDLEALKDVAATAESEIALRQTAADRQLVVRELNHRVKNLFTVVSGMISMTARSSTDTDTMAASLQSRIQALSTAHNLIMPAVADAEGSLKDVSLQTLISMIVEPHIARTNDHMSIEGPTIQIGGKAATSLALALHELATNAAKYGALSLDEGWLEVSWALRDDRILVLDWIENGVTVPDQAAPASRGFGSRLIEVSVTGQLGGKFESKWGRAGMHHHIELPLSVLSS